VIENTILTEVKRNILGLENTLVLVTEEQKVTSLPILNSVKGITAVLLDGQMTVQI
jgi:hypothetical protein